MNKYIPLLLVPGCLFFAAPSCSKKGSPAPTCKLITLTGDVNGSLKVFAISYNNDGNISTIQQTIGTDPYTKVFNYGDKLIMISKSESGTLTETDSIVLNDNGLMTYCQASAVGSLVVTTYTYGGNGQLLKSATQINGGIPSTTTYQYTNGDVTSSFDGSTTTAFTYYTDKAFADGDYLKLEELLTYGALFIKNAHLIKGYQAPGVVENINYTFDNTGIITGITATNGPSIENDTLQYSCH